MYSQHSLKLKFIIIIVIIINDPLLSNLLILWIRFEINSNNLGKFQD